MGFFFLNVRINLGDSDLVGVGVLRHLKKNSLILLQTQTENLCPSRNKDSIDKS